MDQLKNLYKKYPLILIISILAFISCFAIMSAAPMISTKVGNPQSIWLKQLVFYIISCGIIYVIYKIGNEQIFNKIWWIYYFFLFLLVILAAEHFIYTKLWPGHHIIPIVKTTGGATSWFKLPLFQFQPSEFMKIIIVIALAKVTKEFNDYYLVRNFEIEIKYILKCLGIVMPPALLVYLQNDAGVVLIILVGFLFVLFASGLRKQWFIFGVSAIVIIIAIGTYLFLYQPSIFAKIVTGHKLGRFYGWFDPEGTILDQGFQLFYSLLSYGTAGLFGHGFQAVVMQFPEPQTDFIFAVIATCFGFIGASITIGAIIALDIIILKIGLDASNDRDKYMIMGFIGMLLFQQIWNISMILGLLPITGITLPFISYGGSSLLSYMIAIGMIVDVNSQNNILKDRSLY